MSIRKHPLRSLCVGILVAATVPMVHPQDKPKAPDGGGGGFLSALAGPGEKVRFSTDKGPDGKPAKVTTSISSNGDFEKMEAIGAITLESPRLNLKANKLVYNGPAQLIEAEGNVQVKQQMVEATANKLRYDLKTNEIVLSGSPVVTQKSENGETKFSGMDSFVLVTKENGETEARMEGAREIEAELKQAPKDGEKKEVPKPGAGLNSLGNNVLITVAPRGRQAPSIYTNVKESNVDIFRAVGSVRVKTESFDLRADQLEYRGLANELEALYNVFLKQDQIDADCGRMVYDLAQNVMTLTVNPVVRQNSGNGRMIAQKMDSFMIREQADGSYTTEFGGTPQIEIDSAAPASATAAATKPVATPAANGPLEIDVDAVGKQTPKPTPTKTPTRVR